MSCATSLEVVQKYVCTCLWYIHLLAASGSGKWYLPVEAPQSASKFEVPRQVASDAASTATKLYTVSPEALRYARLSVIRKSTLSHV